MAYALGVPRRDFLDARLARGIRLRDKRREDSRRGTPRAYATELIKRLADNAKASAAWGYKRHEYAG